MNREEIKAALLALGPQQRLEVIREVEHESQSKSGLLSVRRNQLDNRQGCCPHCKSNSYRKHGMDKGSQRYLCKDCGRSFTEHTGTWMAGLHKKVLIVDYLKLMEEQHSLDKIKNRLGINKKTAFDWRHKILSGLQRSDREPFQGITESDETFFHFSEKGSRSLGRKPRKRGGDVKTRGIGKDQVAVIVTADRNQRQGLKVAGRGRIKKLDIGRALEKRITKQVVLCSDAHVSYKGFAKDNGLEHHALRPHQKVRGNYHIQNVNAIDSRLKRWIKGNFMGVSTKYLQKYLDWFEADEMFSKSSNFIKDFSGKSLQSISAISDFRATGQRFEELCVLQR